MESHENDFSWASEDGKFCILHIINFIAIACSPAISFEFSSIRDIISIIEQVECKFVYRFEVN